MELLTAETMNFLGSTKNKISKYENAENVLHIEFITEVVLIECNIVYNDYHEDWRALYTFVPDKCFGKLFR